MDSGTAGVRLGVKGLESLKAELEKLPRALQNNVMRGAVRAGANLIAEDARRRVPVMTGQLKASIRIRVFADGWNTTAAIKAGSREKVYKIGKKGVRDKAKNYVTVVDGRSQYQNAFYARFVEFGTQNAPAHPFMRPALDSRRDDAMRAMAEYIGKRLAEGVKAKKVPR